MYKLNSSIHVEEHNIAYEVILPKYQFIENIDRKIYSIIPQGGNKQNPDRGKIHWTKKNGFLCQILCKKKRKKYRE